MCVIIYKPKGSSLSLGELKLCWERNGHGGGFATWKKKGVITSGKGLMTWDNFWNEINPHLSPKSETIIHLRIQSTGGVNPSLTHPFEWKPQHFLFHNGTVKLFFAKSGNSDSEMLAQLLGKIDDVGADTMLKNLNASKHGKFATFTPDGVKLYFDNSNSKLPGDDSVKKGGIWYSNVRHETYDKKKEGPLMVGDGYEFYS